MADGRRIDHLYSSNIPLDARKPTINLRQGDGSIRIIRQSLVQQNRRTPPPPAHARVSPNAGVLHRVSPTPQAAHQWESPPVHLISQHTPVYITKLPAQSLPGKPDFASSALYDDGRRSSSPAGRQIIRVRDKDTLQVPHHPQRPLSRGSPQSNQVQITRISPSQQHIVMSGTGLTQLNPSGISAAVSRLSPVGQQQLIGCPPSREDRPPSRDSWSNSRPNSRPSSRSSVISGGRPRSRDPPLIHMSPGKPHRFSPLQDTTLLPVPTAQSLQLQQLLTQTHPAQRHSPVQQHKIQTVKAVRLNIPGDLRTVSEAQTLLQQNRIVPVVYPSRILQNVLTTHSSVPGVQKSQSQPVSLNASNFRLLEPKVEPSQIVYPKKVSPSIPNVHLIEPKVEPTQIVNPKKTSPSIPNPFFSNFSKLGRTSIDGQSSVRKNRPTPTSAEVAASQALTQLLGNDYIMDNEIASDLTNQHVFHSTNPVAPHSTETVPPLMLAEDAVAPILQNVPESRKKNLLRREVKEEMVVMNNPFNKRLVTLANVAKLQQTSNRSTYRSQTIAMHRAKAGSIINTAKSLDLLRQNLQKDINKELDTVIQRYIDYFKFGIDNIKANNGDNAVSEFHKMAVCRQMLEEAKKMYGGDILSTIPDNSDSVSENGSTTGLYENRYVRENKRNLFKIRRRRASSDSEATPQAPKKKRKGRPPIHASGRSTPSKTTKANEPVKREGTKWDPDRLKLDTLFVMGAKANKALGLGATRGRLYIKHPEVFKYSGDGDDKQWLHEHQHMPATGGKAYMLLVDDVRELAQTEEYRDSHALLLEELVGFVVPDFMLQKMKQQMTTMRTDAPKPPKQGRGRPSLTHSVISLPVTSTLDDDADDRSSTTYQDDDDDEIPHLPFQTMAQRGGKSMPQGSPINMDQFDAMSTDNEDSHSISPFHMTGGFSSNVSPAQGNSPAPSDLDGLDDDAPLTAHFEMT